MLTDEGSCKRKLTYRWFICYPKKAFGSPEEPITYSLKVSLTSGKNEMGALIHSDYSTTSFRFRNTPANLPRPKRRRGSLLNVNVRGSSAAKHFDQAVRNVISIAP